MVNVVIYLKKGHEAQALVRHLLEEKLIASASIDINNVSYKLENSTITEEVYTVVTAQSKSLLFNDIVKAVEAKMGADTPIVSTPIVASNNEFDKTIRNKTMPI